MCVWHAKLKKTLSCWSFRAAPFVSSSWSQHDVQYPSSKWDRLVGCSLPNEQSGHQPSTALNGILILRARLLVSMFLFRRTQKRYMRQMRRWIGRSIPSPYLGLPIVVTLPGKPLGGLNRNEYSTSQCKGQETTYG